MTAREALLTLACVEMETELDGGGVRWWGWGTEGARSTRRFRWHFLFMVTHNSPLVQVCVDYLYDRQRGGGGGHAKNSLMTAKLGTSIARAAEGLILRIRTWHKVCCALDP